MGHLLFIYYGLGLMARLVAGVVIGGVLRRETSTFNIWMLRLTSLFVLIVSLLFSMVLDLPSSTDE